ncbi:transcriptional regulatory protein UME6 [Kluyveromyces marxianus DMKU3-1042]|uniref:Transcriptional regulatory protein UME6 n=1 Tax=Kluyveromyces marxianus (strain DMKU3-1042 / BCC 29191 / NBRC 104275) TaxID=1003335 RepID=W0TB07_KLUMD|nr:transcriptional regulatory protein UME6 [Kluyveromyces marxianus DMKU3-1042]BAO40228.1 transcriptional regulatory protein UME6 [Kluyveromyces marxianus DMKU3-1042]
MQGEPLGHHAHNGTGPASMPALDRGLANSHNMTMNMNMDMNLDSLDSVSPPPRYPVERKTNAAAQVHALTAQRAVVENDEKQLQLQMQMEGRMGVEKEWEKSKTLQTTSLPWNDTRHSMSGEHVQASVQAQTGKRDEETPSAAATTTKTTTTTNNNTLLQPRLNPLIHLAMSHIPAPNNTPVEAADMTPLSGNAYGDSARNPEPLASTNGNDSAGSNNQNMAGRLAARGHELQEKNMSSEAGSASTSTASAAHGSSVTDGKGLSATDGLSGGSGHKVRVSGNIVGSVVSGAYENTRSPVLLFNSENGSGNNIQRSGGADRVGGTAAAAATGTTTSSTNGHVGPTTSTSSSPPNTTSAATATAATASNGNSKGNINATKTDAAAADRNNGNTASSSSAPAQGPAVVVPSISSSVFGTQGDPNSTDRDIHAGSNAMTPRRLHFDSSTEKIDPGAGISSISAQKINITSLLNSRSTAESISPPPSAVDHEYSINFPSSAASNTHSSGSFLQPKYPQHQHQQQHQQHPRLASAMNRMVSPNYLFETEQTQNAFGNIPSASAQSNANANSGSGGSTIQGASITYQPKYFNTKFDELRNRVLLGSSTGFPKLDATHKYPYSNSIPGSGSNSNSNPMSISNPNAHNEQDSNVDAEAAAIISQMRSSPLPAFNEHFGPGTHGSRPNSSLSNQSLQNGSYNQFNKRLLPKPVLRVNQRQFPNNNSQDENAIAEEDDDDDDDDDDEYHEGGYANSQNGGTNVSDTVAWNKNGKRRLSRRKSGPPHYNSQLKGAKQEHVQFLSADISEDNVHFKRSRSSSLSLEPTGLLSPNSKRAKQLKFKESNYNNDVSNEEMVKSSDQIKKRNATGARSRTGCWICRLRKKKCTEEKPQCQNCVRLHLECFYDIVKPDFISDPAKKAAKLDEIKKKTKEAKRQAMKKKTWL